MSGGSSSAIASAKSGYRDPRIENRMPKAKVEVSIDETKDVIYKCDTCDTGAVVSYTLRHSAFWVTYLGESLAIMLDHVNVMH